MRLTQEEIFERYLNVPVDLRGLICSPLRSDKNPTCQFKWRGGKLVFKDFSGHFNGDCFDLVKFMFRCNFHEALDRIAVDFKLTSKTVVKVDYERLVQEEKTKTSIEVKWKGFDKDDLDYWYSQGATSTELQLFNVSPVEYVWVNGEIRYSFREIDRAYGYWFTIEDMKVYFPHRKDYRFLCNTNCIQGYDQLPNKGDVLIITKSLKDIMVLRRFGYYAIAYQSESQIPTQEQYDEFSSRFDVIYSFYDFDYAGVMSACKMRRKYHITPIFLTNGRFKSLNRKAKDISDLYYLGGSDLVKSTIKEIERIYNGV